MLFFSIRKLWQGMIVFFFLPPTLNNVALFLCRCHAICHCYPDWLEDSMPSSVVPCHSLLRLHHIISGSGIHPRRAKLEACHGVSVYCSASVIGFTDNVIVVQEPADPSHPPQPPHSFSLPCTPASCLPPLLMPADEKWPGTRKKERPDTGSQHIQRETLCLHLNGANLLLKSNHYQFHWGQDNWLRIWFSQSKHDYGVP